MAAPQGVQFDGSTPDYLARGADLTGNADSKLVTGAGWVRFNNATTTASEVIWASYTAGFSNRFLLLRHASEAIAIGGYNASATEILNVNTGASSVADTSWHHLMFSFDLSDTAKRHLYLDDGDALNVTTYTNDTIDCTVPNHWVGSVGGIANHLPGDLADFWLDFGTYIDLSVASNRRKFVGASAASSVDLGSDGSNPTGSAPLVFFSGATSTWHTNDGSGGGFTENGALTDASANPPDYAAGAAGNPWYAYAQQ